MHRVHHSTIVRETNSNFGFNLPCWDRLFRTYTEQPTQGHQDMTIGLDDYQNTENTGLYATLMIPFHRDPQP
jgi:sterol desaturase/sphingolipid hydroxylase (fatty acid hydroxylase superfamily)